jgi:TolA-binding protein
MYHDGPMARRPIRSSNAASLFVALAIGTACGNGAQHAAPADDPHALAIPPLGPDAGGPPASEPSTEPIGARSILTVRARDPRIAQRQPRSRTAVLGDIQRLERQLATAATPSVDRPLIRRRLADAYNELAYTSSGPDADRARDKSIEQYIAMRGEQSTSLDDASLYYLALAYEQNGDRPNARRTYFELFATHPRSKLVPLAYFAFGEMFSEEARDDPAKNALALQAYTEVLKFPPADNPIYADALLRIGETHLRMNEDARAKEAFDRLRRELPDSDAAAKVPAAP